MDGSYRSAARVKSLLRCRGVGSWYALTKNGLGPVRTGRLVAVAIVPLVWIGQEYSAAESRMERKGGLC